MPLARCSSSPSPRTRLWSEFPAVRRVTLIYSSVPAPRSTPVCRPASELPDRGAGGGELGTGHPVFPYSCPDLPPTDDIGAQRSVPSHWIAAEFGH